MQIYIKCDKLSPHKKLESDKTLRNDPETAMISQQQTLLAVRRSNIFNYDIVDLLEFNFDAQCKSRRCCGRL